MTGFAPIPSDAPVKDNMKTLAASCIHYFQENPCFLTNVNVQVKRRRFSTLIKRFHEDSGTLTKGVKEKITALRRNDSIVIMTAHQPNLLPYSGVFRKTTLAYVLSRYIEDALDRDVVHLFGLADQDLSNGRWVKTAQLPSVQRRNGVVDLHIKLPTNMMLNMLPKPPRETINQWKKELDKWISENNAMIKDYSGNETEKKMNLTLTKVKDNLNHFWSLVENAHKHASNYSDFNAILFSRIVNTIWDYNTLFVRFSESQQLLKEDFEFLCVNNRVISEASRTTQRARLSSTSKGDNTLQVPFWYHCTCGGKAKLFYTSFSSELRMKGRCVNCRTSYDFDMGTKDLVDLGPIAPRISARAIAMPLIFSRGLGISGYIGGLGSLEYLEEARNVASSLSLPFPPIMYWRPHDWYLGLGQIGAIIAYHQSEDYPDNLERSLSLLSARITKKKRKLTRLERKRRVDGEDSASTISTLRSELSRLHITHTLLKKIPLTINVIPSIIDYAVNIGLNATSKQWIKYLIRDQSLEINMKLKSIWDDVFPSMHSLHSQLYS